MSGLVGTGELLRLLLRRDRVFLPVWLVSLVAYLLATANAVAATYDTPVKIASYAVNLGGSPAVVAFNGPPVALDTIGGILIYETGLSALIGVALMSIFLVVRHTRREEEAGRTELLRSTVVGEHADVAAVLLVATGASVVVGAGCAYALLGNGVQVAGSLVYGAAVAAMGVVYAAVAACAAQLMTHARGAVGLSLAVLAVSFMLRAVGDVGNVAFSFLSPMGWSQQVRALDDNRWWPLLLSLALVVVLVAATVVLTNRRDLGSGIVAARPGPPEAARGLAHPLGLAWHLQRATVVAWVAGIFTLGLIFGSVTEEIQNMVKDNPTLADYIQKASGASLVDSYFGTMLLLIGIGAAGFAVASALRIRGEETSGRLEPVLATAVSRPQMMLGSLVVTVFGSVAVVAAGGLGSGVSYALVTGDASVTWPLVAQAMVFVPAVLVTAGVAVLLVGWAPYASGIAWGALALTFVIGWVGGLLKIPDWFADLSPFTHTPQLPAQDFRLTPVLLLSAVFVVQVVAGLVGFQRRDIGRT
ncbi:MAG: ABC transporter permease [Nocardioidaceae bacterium]